ncbi:MAG TPA: GNAT family N-acetyltransferase [Candidatus Dormibacteraeota bacterium]|nr:GNAT family N-acetyltransferase [Candidatus Dormibacteraeota bacterium]
MRPVRSGEHPFTGLLEWATLAMLRVATPADAPAIARVHVASWRTTYPGMLPDSYLAAMDVRDYTGRWARALSSPVSPGTVTVVEEGGEIVGFASCGRQRDGHQPYEGELYAIYLLQEVQGRGHGRALVEGSAAALAGQRITSMVVWVLRDNAHARGFYERLGGAYLRKRELDFGFGVTAMEVSYLWADTLATLLKRPAPAG